MDGLSDVIVDLKSDKRILERLKSLTEQANLGCRMFKQSVKGITPRLTAMPGTPPRANGCERLRWTGRSKHAADSPHFHRRYRAPEPVLQPASACAREGARSSGPAG